MSHNETKFGELDAEDLLRRLSLATTRINELERRPSFDFLNLKFIEAMNELGEYGSKKHGPLPNSRANHSSPFRVSPFELCYHSVEHFRSYLRGERHDHFNTRRHQLAAVAYNSMMEFHFAGLEGERGGKCGAEFSVNGHELTCTLEAGHSPVRNLWGHWNSALCSGGCR